MNLRRKKDWVGLMVQSKVAVENELGSLPSGTVFLVKRNFNGLHLKSFPCDGCGMSLEAKRVPESYVEVIGRRVQCACGQDLDIRLTESTKHCPSCHSHWMVIDKGFCSPDTPLIVPTGHKLGVVFENPSYTQQQEVPYGRRRTLDFQAVHRDESLFLVHDNGWYVRGEIVADMVVFVVNFQAYHSSYGRVWGSYEGSVYADSELAYNQFRQSFPPEIWNPDDI